MLAQVKLKILGTFLDVLHVNNINVVLLMCFDSVLVHGIFPQAMRGIVPPCINFEVHRQ